MKKHNYIDSPIEQGIKEAIQKAQTQGGAASLVLVFPDTPQLVIDALAENIALLVEQEYDILVFTDTEE